MKKSNLLIIGGIVVAAGLILRGFSNSITTSFKGLKWLGFDNLRMRFSLLYDVVNNNDITATVSGMKGKIFYGEYRLSDVTVDKAITIQPGGTETVEVKFSVSPGTLVGELTRFLEEKSGFKKFRLKGTMAGNVGKVPFVIPINENLGLAE